MTGDQVTPVLARRARKIHLMCRQLSVLEGKGTRLGASRVGWVRKMRAVRASRTASSFERER